MGVEDALNLTREALEELPDNRRTQTITRHQLEDALDELADALVDRPTSCTDIAARLRELSQHTATVVDIARTIANDLAGEADGDLLFWAEATQRAIDSWLE